jgi:hypothetical protein
MNMRSNVAPRTATTPEPIQRRREGRLGHRRSGAALGAAAGLALAAAVMGCTPGASGVPGPSVALPSVVLPSIDASALASAGAQAALAALDQVDAAITANTSSTGFTPEEAAALKSLTADLRTKLQSGDLPSARTAFDALSAKVDELANKMGGDTGTRLKDAVAALKALIPAG